MSSRLALAVAGAGVSSLYVLDGDGGLLRQPRLLHRTPARLAEPVLAASGDLVVAASTGSADGLQFGLVCVDSADRAVVAELREEGAGNVLPRAFSPRPGDARVLATSDRSGSAVRCCGTHARARDTT